MSGKLFPFTKDERKAQAVRILKGIRVPRRDLYLPTNPESRVVSLVPESGQPMQSAAKASNAELLGVRQDMLIIEGNFLVAWPQVPCVFHRTLSNCQAARNKIG